MASDEDSDVRLLVSQYEYLPGALLEKLLRDSALQVRAKALERSDVPQDLLTQIAIGKPGFEREVVWRNPITPKRVLSQVFKRELYFTDTMGIVRMADYSFISSLLANPSLPLKDCLVVAREGEFSHISALLHHRQDPELLGAAFANKNDVIWQGLLERGFHPNIAAQIEIAEKGNIDTRVALLGIHNLSSAAQEILAQDDHERLLYARYAIPYQDEDDSFEV